MLSMFKDHMPTIIRLPYDISFSDKIAFFLNDNLWLKCKVDVGWYKMQDKGRTS